MYNLFYGCASLVWTAHSQGCQPSALRQAQDIGNPYPQSAAYSVFNWHNKNKGINAFAAVAVLC